MTGYALSFELVIYALFALCLVHARRAGTAAVGGLVAGVAFGLLLEWGTIRELHAYSYGRFLVMLGDVPLAIGVAWGCIVYGARLFSEASSLPGWARPVLAALFALNIDLSMDAVAIRLGFWHWGLDIHSEYFGVPYANFWAWFWVVLSFTAGLRYLLVMRHPWHPWLAPIGAVVTGVVVVLFTNQLIKTVSTVSYPLYVVAVIAVVGGAVVLILRLRPRMGRGASGGPPTWVPLAFHGFFLAAGVVSGIYARVPALLVVSLLMAGIALVVHGRGLGGRLATVGNRLAR